MCYFQRIFMFCPCRCSPYGDHGSELRENHPLAPDQHFSSIYGSNKVACDERKTLLGKDTEAWRECKNSNSKGPATDPIEYKEHSGLCLKCQVTCTN